jgi:tetratricopeptide (TPR) repeat protein
VRPRPATILHLLLAATTPLAAGCATKRATATARPEIPDVIADLDEFYVALNDFSLLEPGAPRHEAFRATLLSYLIRHMDEALTDGDEDEALDSLQYAIALFTPSELRSPIADPALARAGQRLYEVAARRGAEQPTLLALAVEQQFGSASTRADAVRRWAELEDWILRNAYWAQEPVMRHEELQESLDEIAAVFPTSFVVKRLADLYVARSDAARRAESRGMQMDAVIRGMMEFSGYLIIRLYLRADDLEGVAEALTRVETSMPVRKLAELVEAAHKPSRSARPLLTLAEQFLPEGRGDIPAVFDTQGWGIVHNLALRAVREHPDDAYAHHLLARSLSQKGLYDAAIVHLKRTLDAREDIHEVWEQLADLQQRSLVHLSSMDPAAALKRLEELEEFHRRAVKLWRDRPIRPGLAEAYFVVAEGLYSIGRVGHAEGLLERSLEIEAHPSALDLLGTIALKRARFKEARQRYQRLVSLGSDDALSRLRWSVRARRALGEIERRRGNTERSTEQMRLALRAVDVLLTRPELDEEARAETLVERGKLHFHLGETARAMTDFREAAHVAPGSGAAYAGPLLFAVSYGYYDDAREIYRRALGSKHLRAGLKLYFSLWMNELAQRQGRARDEDASKFLSDFEGEGWEKRLALHAQGKLDFPTLIAAARDAGERAEAYFYEALRRWRTGDPEAAKKLMRKVLKTNMMSFFEYDMALAYLEWNDLPRTARPPMASGRAPRRAPRQTTPKGR